MKGWLELLRGGVGENEADNLHSLAQAHLVGKVRHPLDAKWGGGVGKEQQKRDSYLVRKNAAASLEPGSVLRNVRARNLRKRHELQRTAHGGDKETAN
jgi:hypothetical protein